MNPLIPRPMGEVGRELFASDLEWDLRQRAASRAIQEFCLCLRFHKERNSIIARGRAG